MFTKAIVRPPAPNFSEGLTTVGSDAGLDPPQYERAVEQHAAYCVALEQCGLTLTMLEPDPNYPDSTFVEDTAILTERFDGTTKDCAVVTRPGAPSRRGEANQMRSVLAEFFPEVLSINEPGTLDGGDVCQAGNNFFIGLSERTNEAGAQQLADLLSPLGYTSSFVDIRKIDGMLHLKSGLAYVGDDRLILSEGLYDDLASDSQTDGLRYDHIFTEFALVRVDSEQAYAANCIRVNDHMLVAAGYPSFEATLREFGYQTIALEMSEFQKMDGGLSCLSLRF